MHPWSALSQDEGLLHGIRVVPWLCCVLNIPGLGHHDLGGLRSEGSPEAAALSTPDKAKISK